MLIFAKMQIGKDADCELVRRCGGEGGLVKGRFSQWRDPRGEIRDEEIEDEEHEGGDKEEMAETVQKSAKGQIPGATTWIHGCRWDAVLPYVQALPEVRLPAHTESG